MILQIYSVRRKIRVFQFQSSVSSFATSRKLLCSNLSGRHIKFLNFRNGRKVGPCLDATYTDKIFGNLKFTNHVNDYLLVSGQQHYPARVLLYTAIYIRVKVRTGSYLHV
jgi:hypothetical protein